jgi:DNA-directed RNA polymerase specialized sigma24 family protein
MTIGSNPPPVRFHQPEDELDLALKDFLLRGSSFAHSLSTFVQARLRQFHLSGSLEVSDIVLDAYLRGKCSQAKGDKIEQPKAWLKTTCFHIIREHSRKQKRECLSPPDLMEFFHQLTDGSQVGEAILEDKLSAAMRALHILRSRDPEAAELLVLRIYEGLSWEAIHQRFVQEGRNYVPSIAALRQQGCRINKKLRSIYHEEEE